MTPSPIAIVGVGCRFPGGASDLDKLWQLISEGRSGQTEIPKSRWNADEWFDAYPEAKQSMVTKHGYFLQEDISQFDAKFFGISNAEAHCMDPQQRLFLMTTYEALEDAAIPVETLRGSNTSVFASIFERSYDRMGHKDLSTIGRTHLNGTGESILSNRISYCFDLRGPCMTIDTGCSGSLVALHQACHSLRSGETDLALVGGAQLVIHPDLMPIMSEMGMLNPDGKSYTFDSRGAGYGRGEGVATIVLKRLDQALENGDRIHAIIANSGVNQDGKTSGLNTPSSDAQMALLSRVYREAGLDPANTSFVEAHGTGTQAGDREEIASINKAFCVDSGRTDDIYVGSIKTNIGHLEASSGIAGLLKSILVLKHGYIPPNLNYIKPKPSLKLYEKKIKIPTELTKLPASHGGGAAQVSLNSFGYGGTNCHVILQAASAAGKSSSKINGASYLEGIANGSLGANGVSHLNGHSLPNPDAEHNPNVATTQLFVLSASTEKALAALSQNLREWIETHELTAQALRDLSYTLAVHRSALSYRRSILASTGETLAAELDQSINPKRAMSLAPLTFVFSGQGAQWHAMGRELMSLPGHFRDSISSMDSVLRQQGSRWSLADELSKTAETSRIDEAEISQPATTAIQIALVDLLGSLSIRPSRVVGHSSGEIAAAYAAGALSRDSAIIVAYQRGLFSLKAKADADVAGSMLAVGLGEADASGYIKRITSGAVTVACVNSPSSTTISGDETAIDELKAILDSDSVFSQKLRVDTAYHSHHMQRVAHDYQDKIKSIESSDAQEDVIFYSSVVGETKTTGFGAEYWTSNLVSQVKFSQALALLKDDQIKTEVSMDSSIFIEIGPHSALAGPSRQTLNHGKSGKFKFEYLSVLVRNNDAVQTTLSLIGRLFELGLKVDLGSALKLSSQTKPAVIRDLKPYPWDLAPFWHESRLSRASRFRPFPHHDLLGLLDPASTIQEPRWRYFLNLDALPWLRDHVVEGFILYPGAGYLTMAIEAMKQYVQMKNEERSVAKYVLRDVSISKSLVLNEAESSSGSSDVEVQLSMSSPSEDSRWRFFRICSYQEDGSWSEHCSGEITVEYKSGENNEVEGSREADLREEQAIAFLEEARRVSTTDMTKTEFYESAKRTGNEWNGAFTPIDVFKYGSEQGMAILSNPDIGSLMPYRSFRPHVIHPITFDAFHQVIGMLFKKFILDAPCVPTKISLLEISTDLSSSAGDGLTSALKIQADGPNAGKGQCWGFQESPDGRLKPVIRLEVGLRAIGEALEDDNRPFIQDKVNRLDWNIDEEFLTEPSFLDMLSSTRGLDENTTYDYEGAKVSLDKARESFIVADQASSIWIRDAVNYVEANKIDITIPHLVKYFGWMQKWLGSDYHKEIMSGLTADDEISILQRIESNTDAAELQLLARIGKALPNILSGTVEPLAVMLEDNLLIKTYESGTFTGDYESAVAYLKLLTFKKPRLRFLEIGAGTGGCTKRLLGDLASNGGGSALPLERYTYTDISSGFFEEARKGFVGWGDYMDFKTLDVERDPLEQGYELESYDVIVASNVLHATKHMDVTMSHVRRLLRPGGSLILVENSPKGAVIGLMFGTLAGWWAHEDDFRDDTALMPREQWTKILSRNGFGGIHVARGNMMVSKAVPLESKGVVDGTRKIVLLQDAANSDAEELVKRLGSLDASINIKNSTWNGLIVDDDTLYLVVDRAEKPLLLDPQPQLFTTLNALLSAKASILWVVIQDTDDAVSTAYKGLVTAFIRVLRRESGNSRFISLDVRQSALGPDETARVVREVSERCFWPATPDKRSSEPEFAYDNGTLIIPRVKPDAEFLRWARSGQDRTAAAQTETTLYQGDRSVKLEVATPGLLGSMRFVDNELSAEIEPSHVEVKVEAHGINNVDVSVALGQIGSAVNMVGEFAGIVTAVGQGMEDTFQVGDRVMGFGVQPFSNLSRVNGHYIHKIPDGMEASAAASISTAFTTAYQCVVVASRLETGQSVLVHAASEDVGQAVIQLAQHIGASVFCTVNSSVERQLLIDEYKIPETHIFSSLGGSFKQGIMRLTNGEGVDVVLNSLAGETLRDSIECVSTLGTFIELGKSDIQKGSRLSMAAFERSITFTAFDLASFSRRKPKQVRRIFSEIMKLIDSKTLRPVQSVTTYPIEQIEDAFRSVSAKKHAGKVVVTVDPTSSVRCLPAKHVPLQLRKDGTYVVAGGLGDLPSRICKFFASRGAGHIVSLSRRTIDDETRQKFTAEVEAHGGKLHILKCDITVDEQMQEAVAYCSSLPPVRGVIQGALALRDRTFTQMTVDEWKLPLQPKVYGTINLDKFFASADLAFFVTLSSIVSVIGKSGQSNYAAGNGFQDAFARAHAGHPHAHYVSINIGSVSIDAHGALEASENETAISSIRASLRQNSVMDISFDEFFANFEYTMTDFARKTELHQTIQGVTRQSMLDAHDEYLLENPVFSQLPHAQENKSGGVTKTEKVDFVDALGRVNTMAEAEELIRDATLAKFAVFLDRSLDDIKVDQPLATIGLDSLVSIELKNWMVRTFQVNLQTSELSGAGTIMVLTATVASRSKLIPDKIRKPEAEENKTLEKVNDKSQPGLFNNSHGFYCCRTSKELPRYPLLDLDEAVKDLLNSIGHFAHTREEFTELSRKAHSLAAPGSLGRRLYDQLRVKAEDPKVESWIADLLLKALHLKRRYPLAPYGNFLGTHFDSPVPHTQAERAALLTGVICRFKRDRDEAKLEPDFLGSRAICDHSLSWLFNAVREPNVGCDKMMKYPGNEYIAVLRRGHLFKVQLPEDADVAFDKMKATFQAIIDLDLPEKSWAGILTTDNRDAWGSNRQKLLSLDSRNAFYITTIEASVFVLCLDDDSPVTRPERIYSGYIGDSFNRWHDKCMQLIVNANGRSGIIYEHSMIDSTTTSQLAHRIKDAIESFTPARGTDNKDSIMMNTGSLEEIPLFTSPDIDARMETLRGDYLAITSTKQYVPHKIPSFGKSLFLSHSAPIKATVDLTIQLASRLHFGYLPASWETVSTAHFHLGRPEIVQVVLRSVIDFCDAALDEAVPRAEVRTKLLQAARECNAQIAKGSEGRNYFRLMDVLEVMSQDQPGAEVPELFSDPVWKRGYPQLIMQTMTETKIAEDPGFTMPHPDSVWTNYTVFDDCVEVSFVSPVSSGEGFQTALNRAADIVKSVIAAK
ncbi:hypothetical protein S40285_08484 [Stachybotrys chlorohalonatus IBT 40285]|uniref:Uncharacterized protein n=1 Tax=Stachybotrys chlorohalonatus (strain IBT 40285) TaxID=1283841 RepID=A0A084Q7Q2_STAC4|nr:hypothetical protein S40285_08484 [Stachybotrys chlorohalonata IBT 40285]